MAMQNAALSHQTDQHQDKAKKGDKPNNRSQHRDAGNIKRDERNSGCQPDPCADDAKLPAFAGDFQRQGQRDEGRIRLEKIVQRSLEPPRQNTLCRLLLIARTKQILYET